MSPRTADVVIVGGGIIGFAIAHALAKRGQKGIVLLEKEAQVGTGATSKATGGIRHQFSTEVNVRLTQLSYPTFTSFPEQFGQEIGFRTHGYLIVASTPEVWAGLRASAELQQRLGVPTRILSPGEVEPLFPTIRTDDLVGATFCGLDASASPTDALQGYRRAVRDQGVEIVTGAAVIAVDRDGGRVSGVRTADDRIATRTVVDAAGPYVSEVASFVGVDLPARPFRRQLFVVGAIPGFPLNAPMTIDLVTGWYVHQDGNGTILMGGTDKDSRPGLDPVVDWDKFDLVAEAAMKRIPRLAERMEMRSAYAGIRTLTPDFHGILGRTPVEGFYVATNCNGHGFMHAPAVGLLLAEEILDGGARTLDITPLSLARFADAKPHAEAVMF